jgi:RNA polymerase II-associated protein 3
MCQTSLEPPLLVSILTTFSTLLEAYPDISSDVKNYMVNLGNVPRFPMVTMLMSKEEKRLAARVWEKVGVEGEERWA